MQAFAFVLIALFSSLTYACDSYVVGFKGKNQAFDQKAFETYVGSKCAALYPAEQTEQAIKFINTLSVPYELYGFSLGAQSVRTVLTKTTTKPTFVLTIGAYHTANVNFDKYGVKYKNYFDSSGTRQLSPGIHVPGVPHMKMQEYVNKEILK